MKLNRPHIPWAIFVLAATILAGSFYLAEFHPERVPFGLDLPRFMHEAPRERASYGASPLGLFYGALALAIFVFASALGIRKKRRLWPIGSVQGWLRAHIWLTILTIPLVLFHSGFQFGGGHTTTVMILYIIVMVSGFLGLAIQNVLPTLMKERLPREIVYEQIPHVHDRIVESAILFQRSLKEKTRGPRVATAEGATAVAVQADDSESVLLEFMENECMPYLQANRRRASRMRMSRQKVGDDTFRLLRLNVSDSYMAKVDELQIWCDDRRRMDVQVRMHHWMHVWLLFHVPFSFALLIFTFWHAYVTWIYL